MKPRKLHLLRLAGVALCAAVGGSLWSPAAPGQPETSILDERGLLTCRAFTGMSRGLQSAFLLGVREGWRTSAAALDANARMREDLAPEYQESLQAGAIYLRRLIDYSGVPPSQVLDRTREGCQADPDAAAWKAWLDAVARGRSPAGGGG